MSSSKLNSFVSGFAVFGFAAAIHLGVVTPASALSLSCKGLGSPSFSATRTTESKLRGTTKSKVYVTKSGEREETRRGSGVDVRIVSAKATYIFNESRGDGIILPKPKRPRGPKGSKISSERVGKNTVLTEFIPSQNGGVVAGSKITCSPRGVPLEHQFIVPTKSNKLDVITIKHTNIRLGSQSKKLFQPPKSIKFKK